MSQIVDQNPDVFLIRKGWNELVLIMKGNTPEFLEEERDLILERIRQEAKRNRYQLTAGVGTPKKRIADIYQSFIEAWVGTQDTVYRGGPGTNPTVDKAELLKADRSAIENFLKSAVKPDFAAFFDGFFPVSY